MRPGLITLCLVLRALQRGRAPSRARRLPPTAAMPATAGQARWGDSSKLADAPDTAVDPGDFMSYRVLLIRSVVISWLMKVRHHPCTC